MNNTNYSQLLTSSLESKIAIIGDKIQQLEIEKSGYIFLLTSILDTLQENEELKHKVKILQENKEK